MGRSVRRPEARLLKIAPHYYYPGWWEGNAALHAFINLDKWNALPKDYQAILRAACAEANMWMRTQVRRRQSQGAARAGRRRRQAAAVLAADPGGVVQAANETYAEITAKNAAFKKIYDSMMAFRKEEVLWFRVAENTFDNFMARQSAAGKL